MTLGKLFREIISASGVPEDRVRKLDITNLINQTISDLRVQFIRNGLGSEFTVDENITSTSKNTTDYPFLYEATLSNTLMRGLPISMTVQESMFWKTSDELEDSIQSWTKGDLAYKDGVAYEALEDISSENTYDLTFSVDNVKNYYNNNGLEFKEDDIVFNQSDGTYWRCTSDYTNDQGQAIGASGNFEQLFWRRVDDAYYQGSPVQFNSLFQTVLSDMIDNHYPFSIREDVFYTTVSNTPITLSYIPEWQYKEGFDEELNIPDMLVQPVRNRCIQLIGSKLGIDNELTPEVTQQNFFKSEEDG